MYMHEDEYILEKVPDIVKKFPVLEGGGKKYSIAHNTLLVHMLSSSVEMMKEIFNISRI